MLLIVIAMKSNYVLVVWFISNNIIVLANLTNMTRLISNDF